MSIQLICRPFITPIHLTVSRWRCQYKIAAFPVLPSSSFPTYPSISVILMNISSQCSHEAHGYYHHLQRTCLWLYNLWQSWEQDQEIRCFSALPLLLFMSWTPVHWWRTTKQLSDGNKLLQSLQT